MVNLGALGTMDGVKRLVVPISEQGRALEKLRAMNLTRASLFPGLEGFAQSFRQVLMEEPAEQKKARLTRRFILERLRQSIGEKLPPREAPEEPES